MLERTIRSAEIQQNFTRIFYLQNGFNILNKNPIRYINGIGLFNDQTLRDENIIMVKKDGGIKSFENFHSSYAEIFWRWNSIIHSFYNIST